MKNQLLILFLLTSAVTLKAQLGITVSITQGRAGRWQVIPENYITKRRTEFLHDGTNGVIDFVIPLKKEGIRLRPALDLMFVNSVYYPHYFRLGILGAQGNVEFALWGKFDRHGNRTPIRPYLQISPGIAIASMRYDRPTNAEYTEFEFFRSHCLAPSIGSSLFLEFKLTPLLTVAPAVGFRYYHKLSWKNFTEIITNGAMIGTHDRSSIWQYNFGVRAGLALK
jgi:hypothetical protein